MSNKYLLKIILYYGNKDTHDMKNVEVKFEGDKNGHIWINQNIDDGKIEAKS